MEMLDISGRRTFPPPVGNRLFSHVGIPIPSPERLQLLRRGDGESLVRGPARRLHLVGEIIQMLCESAASVLLHLRLVPSCHRIADVAPTWRQQQFPANDKPPLSSDNNPSNNIPTIGPRRLSTSTCGVLSTHATHTKEDTVADAIVQLVNSYPLLFATLVTVTVMVVVLALVALLLIAVLGPNPGPGSNALRVLELITRIFDGSQ